MRERVQCLILQDNKILFVKDIHASHYYPPGGSIDEGEDHTQAMDRELQEELCLRLQNAEYYFSYDEHNIVHNLPQREHNYFVTITGEPRPASEVEDFRWVTWQEVTEGAYILPPAMYDMLMVRLHEDGHLL